MVARYDLAFDCFGYCPRDRFLAGYIDMMRTAFPYWTASFLPLELDPIGWEFCTRYRHRHPTQFPRDALARARAFIAQFPAPSAQPSR